jgi:hypothetical protein
MEQKVSYGVAHFGGTEKNAPFLVGLSLSPVNFLEQRRKP